MVLGLLVISPEQNYLIILANRYGVKQFITSKSYSVGRSPRKVFEGKEGPSTHDVFTYRFSTTLLASKSAIIKTQ